MEKTVKITRHITNDMQRTYFELPFEVPPNVERIDVRYDYLHHQIGASTGDLSGETITEVNIVDLGLSSPDGFVGASGSSRKHIWVAEQGSARGYSSTKLTKGSWGIIVGAYKVAPEGVEVTYEITFTFKELRMFRGDTHMHTIASDGRNTVAELAQKAVKLGLDFLILTDHNNYAQNFQITGTEEVTLIPGSEWTLYNGHCNMWGATRPLKNALNVNSLADMQERIREARANGARISVNHPFSDCPWTWGMENTDYDTIEVWNGGTLPNENLLALNWWHQQLCEGKQIAAVGGSDYHYTEFMRELGQPTLCVWANSNSPGDILEAITAGRSCITSEPNGTTALLKTTDAITGGTSKAEEVFIELRGLKAGDKIHLITNDSRETITSEDNMTRASLARSTQGKTFYRVEVSRAPFSDFTGYPIMVSNPIYFKQNLPPQENL